MDIERPPFPSEEFDRRVTAVREGMRREGLETLIVTTPENIYYLSGFTNRAYYTFQALVLPLEGEPVTVIRRLEEPAVKQLSRFPKCALWTDTEDPLDVLVSTLAEMGLRTSRVGVEERSLFLPVHAYVRLQEALDGSLRRAAGIVESCRAIKTEAEIAYTRQAAQAVQAAMAAGIAAVRPGATENEVAAALYAGALRAGSEYMASQPYVKSGPRTGLPHVTWSGREIGAGELVHIELSCCVRRYGAAMVRTISVGRPTPEVVRAATASLEGIKSAIGTMAPGVAAAHVDRACRGAVERLGFGRSFVHRTAYSIGIGICPAWGEGGVMDIKPGDPRRLEAGMIFHVVPLLEIDDRTSIGCSATVLVTASGAEPLTGIPDAIVTV
jgi:Xaa-Pro dipeptidase